MTHIIDGVEIHTNSDGKVMWMSDWTRCYDFVKRGIFCKKFYRRDYGHTDFYLK